MYSSLFNGSAHSAAASWIMSTRLGLFLEGLVEGGGDQNPSHVAPFSASRKQTCSPPNTTTYEKRKVKKKTNKQ